MRERNRAEAPKRLLHPARFQRDEEFRISELEITARELLKTTRPPQSWGSEEFYYGVTPLYDGIFEESIRRVVRQEQNEMLRQLARERLIEMGVIIVLAVAADFLLRWLLR